jgi:hypothetical protein
MTGDFDKVQEMSFNIDITGLEKLQRELEEVVQAMPSLEGDIARLSVDPSDPGAAVRQMESAIDSKVASYAGNTLVSQLVDDVKRQFREEILERAKWLLR